MKIKSVIYIDGNGNEFPIKINGHRLSNLEEMMINLDICGLDPKDTISVRIVNNCAELRKGSAITDADDITYAHADTDGNVVLSGYGG